MPRRKKNKILNKPASLQKYRERMLQLENQFPIFENAWMSSFELYSTVEEIGENSDMDCFSGVLLRLVREKGVNVRGVTSERKLKGEYICPSLLGVPRAECNIIYIGKYSFFSGHDRSPFSPVAADNVYLPEAEEAPSQ